jgi:hypothetical protein
MIRVLLFSLIFTLLGSCIPEPKKKKQIPIAHVGHTTSYDFLDLVVKIPSNFYVEFDNVKDSVQTLTLWASLNDYNYQLYVQGFFADSMGYDEYGYTVNDLVNAEMTTVFEDKILSKLQMMKTIDGQEIYYFSAVDPATEMHTIVGIMLGSNNYFYRLQAISTNANMSYLYKKTMNLWYQIKRKE